MFCGLAGDLPESAQFARRLAEAGCLVANLMLISRSDAFSGNPHASFTNQPHRECFYRALHLSGCTLARPLSKVKSTASDQRSNVFALSVKVLNSSPRFPGNTSTFSFRSAKTCVSNTPCTPRICGGSSMGSPLLLNDA